MRQAPRKIMIKINLKTNFKNENLRILTNLMMIIVQDVELSQCPVLHGTQMKLKKIRFRSRKILCQLNKNQIFYNKIHIFKINFHSIKMKEIIYKRLKSNKYLKKNKSKFSKTKKKVQILIHKRLKKILRKISQISILKP